MTRGRRTATRQRIPTRSVCRTSLRILSESGSLVEMDSLLGLLPPPFRPRRPPRPPRPLWRPSQPFSTSLPHLTVLGLRVISSWESSSSRDLPLPSPNTTS
eukprot:3710576-Rhodomonas_salina.1